MDHALHSPNNDLSIAPGYRAIAHANRWLSLDDLFAVTNDGALAKPGLPNWRERIRTFLRNPEGGEIEVYVKRFSRIPLSQQLRRWWSGDAYHGAAWTEWCRLGELARAGIPAAEPIAYGQEMTGPWERRSAVVMRAVRGESLERWCAAHDEPLPDAVLDAMAELVASFHGLGVAHRDLYLSHIFWDSQDTGDTRLALIDLQRVVRHRGRRRWIVKDLAALNHSAPPGALAPRERMRWFKRYLQLRNAAPMQDGRQSSKLRQQDRVLLRLIIGRTAQMRRHDERRAKRG